MSTHTQWHLLVDAAADEVDQAVKELRSEMAVEFNDSRLGYVVVQINREAWETLDGH